MEVEEKVKNLIKNVADGLVKVVRKNAFYLVDDYLNLDQDKLITYDPRNGILEFQLWLPINMPSMQAMSMPDFSVLFEMYAKLKEFIQKALPQDVSPYDYYYKYKPADLTNLLPPFKSML